MNAFADEPVKYHVIKSVTQLVSDGQFSGFLIESQRNLCLVNSVPDLDCGTEILKPFSNFFCKKVQEQEKQYHATDDPVGGEATEPLGQLVKTLSKVSHN
jgi:hypothetical protein